MKTTLPILFTASILLFLTACKDTQNKSAGTIETPNPEKATERNDSLPRNPEAVYRSLPYRELPVASGPDLLATFPTETRLTETEVHRLTDIGDSPSPYNETIRAIRLPEKKGLRFLLTAYQENYAWIIDLYSLSEELEAKDRLRVYSEETLNEGKSVVKQDFVIENGIRTVVSKHLNGTLIERLTYVPAEDGMFNELRDGETTTVAYDSYDGITYIVETFVWDRNASGGLVKKELRTENYRLTEDGNLVKTGKTP